MAAVTLLGSATFTTSNGTKTVTATPAINDLIVIITAHSGNTSTVAPTDDQGGTYTHEKTAVKNTSADTMQVWIRNDLIRAAASTVFTHAPGTTSGGGLAVLKVTCMSRCGITNAVVQSAIQDNGAGAATPSPVLGTAATTTNALIGAVFNASNPATLTPRASWTERADVGYNTPTSGLEVMSRDSGETGTTLSWGGTSATAWCSLVIELNNAATPVKRQSSLGVG